MAAPPFIVIPYEPVSIDANPLGIASRPASHLFEFLYPGMRFQLPSAVAESYVIADFGTPRPIDFCAVLQGAVSGTTTAQFYLGTQVSLIGNLYTGPLQPFPDINPVPVPENFLLHSFHTLPSVISARAAGIWVRNQVTNPFSAAFMVVGKRITFQRYAEHDWEVGVDDQSQVSITRDGVPDIVEGAILRTLSFTMKWVSEAEYFERVAPLDEAVGRRKPVLICFDPDAGPRRQALTYFGLLRENPRSRRINARAFERRFEILSFI